jgi:multiple sugar transport system substrate-binding protein
MKAYRNLTVIALTIVVLLVAACAGPGDAATSGAQPTAEMAVTTAPTMAAEPTMAATMAAEPTLAATDGAEPTAAATETAGTATGGAMETIEVEEGARLVFSGWGEPAEQQIYRDSIDRFNEVYPDVTVDFQPIPADFQTKIKAQMAGGTAPDVMYIDDQLMTAFAPNGQLLALDEYMDEAGVSTDAFIPALMTPFTYEGEVYALPKDWGTLGLVYLPEAFADAGIDEPTEDWTWDDLQTAAQAIADKGTYAGFCMNADWARFAPFVFGAGGSYTNDDFTQAAVNSPEVLEAAQFVAGMKESGALVTSSDVGAGWCGEAIGKKLVAMTYEGGWMVNTMRLDFADVEWNAVPLPAGPEGQASVIFTNGIGVNAATSFPRAAAALAMFLTGADNQEAIVSTGFAYSTHADQVELVQDPKDQAIATAGTWEMTRVGYWGPNTGRVNDAISKALERVYLGDQTVEEAFAQAETEVQAALDNQ